MNNQYSLYRFYNSNDVLLYIGMSCNVLSRVFRSHRANTPWINEVAKILIEHYENKPAVMSAESESVKNEHPLYNVKLLKQAKPERTRREHWIYAARRRNASSK